MGATFGYRLNAGHHRRFELFTGHTMFPDAGRKAGTISHGQMWAILPQTWLGNFGRFRCFVALLYSWGGGGLLPTEYQHRSLSRAGENHHARHSTVLQKARCVTGWFVWQSGWRNPHEGTAKFLAITGWCLLAFIASATSTPSRI